MKRLLTAMAVVGASLVAVLVRGPAIDELTVYLVVLLSAVACVSLLDDVRPVRILLVVALAALASGSRHLLAIAAATQLPALLVSRSSMVPLALFGSGIVLIGVATGALDLSSVGASPQAGSFAVTAGVLLLMGGFAVSFALVALGALRDARRPPVEGALLTVALLVAATSALARLAAWLPELSGLIELTAWTVAVLTLGGGALGTLLAERLRSFVTGVALFQAGLAALALAGGVHGRPALLMQLPAASVAILFLGLGLGLRPDREPLTLSALATSPRSTASRLLVGVGALAALALPPSPGFAARLSTASALLGRHAWVGFALSLALTAVLGVGLSRLLSATLQAPSNEKSGRSVTELLAYAFVILAVVGLGVAPERLVEAARRAATALF